GGLSVLDEPLTGGLNRDSDGLIGTCKHLRDLGNSVIVVERVEDAIRAADHVIDMGPGAGIHGGDIIVSGPPAEVIACEASLTGQYLAGRRRIEIPARRVAPGERVLRVAGA